MNMCPMCQAQLPSCCLTGSCESMDTTPSVGETLPMKKPERLSEPTPPVIPSHIVLGIEITNEGLDADSPSQNSEFMDSNPRRSERRSGRKRGGSDTQSAGRKVAAKLYPLNGDAPCEWQGLSNCGGGDYPILGCLEGKQEARHHGPEKNVQNNETGNVHRICHYCHYRWHAKNDPSYDWNAGVWTPHSPRPMVAQEQTKQAIDYMRYLTTGRRAKKLKEVD